MKKTCLSLIMAAMIAFVSGGMLMAESKKQNTSKGNLSLEQSDKKPAKKGKKKKKHTQPKPVSQN